MGHANVLKILVVSFCVVNVCGWIKAAYFML